MNLKVNENGSDFPSRDHKDLKRLNPEDLGMPPASMDPMKTIQMEGAMFRGMSSFKGERSIPVRIAAILIGLLFFVGWGIVYLWGAIVAINKGTPGLGWGRFIGSLIWIACGAVIIWANIRTSKKK